METQTQAPPSLSPTDMPPMQVLPTDEGQGMPPAGMSPLDDHPAESANSKGSLKVILAVLLTALLVGGGIYFWQRTVIANINASNSSMLLQGQQQVQDLRVQIGEMEVSLQEAGESAEVVESLEIELQAEKVKFAMLDFWGVNNLVNDPENSNHFYYANNFGGNSNLAVYNLIEDSSFQLGMGYDFPGANTVLFSNDIGSENEFVIVDIVEGEVVFIESPIDNSPGPCYSLVLDDNLKSFNIGTEVVNDSYNLPEEMLTSAQLEYNACIEELNA